MSYIRTVTSRGHKYRQLCETVWDKERKRPRVVVLEHLGTVMEKDGREEVSAARPRVDAVLSSFPVGPLSLFYALAKQLKLGEHISDVLGTEERISSCVLYMVINQIVGRRPIYELPAWINGSPLVEWEGTGPVDRGAISGALGALCRLRSDGVIEDRGLALQRELTHAWKNGGREPPQYYYDITRQLYYGGECGYAAPGYYPGGTHRHVIAFGLITSRVHHHPVMCRAIEGSKNDTVTVRDITNALGAWDMGGLTLILDRGMISEQNMRLVTEAGFNLVGIVPETNRAVWEYIARWPRQQLEQPRFLVLHPSGDTAYARGWTAQLFGRRMRVAVIENPSVREEEKSARDTALFELDRTADAQRLRELRNELKHVVSTARGRRGFAVDSGKLEEEAKRDGRYLMFSTDMSMDAEQMFSVCFQRDVVEKAFRTIKGAISLGPIRYRRRDRIDAYTTVVYMAYLLWSMAERRVREKFPRTTLEKALKSLSDVYAVKFSSGKSHHAWTTRLTDGQEKLLRLFEADELMHRY